MTDSAINFALPSKTRSLLCLILLTWMLPSLCLADRGRKARIAVNVQFDPVSSIGLLISPTTSLQILDTETSRDSSGNIIVSFPYSKAQTAKGMVASAMVVSESGEIAFGRTVPLAGKAGGASMYARLPECKNKLPSGTTIQGQYALLESLVEIRGKRRRYSRVKLEEILDDVFLDRLKKIESGFGLESSSALDPMMNPVDLAQRLSALKAAVMTYETYKAKNQKAADAAQVSVGEAKLTDQ